MRFGSVNTKMMASNMTFAKVESTQYWEIGLSDIKVANVSL